MIANGVPPAVGPLVAVLDQLDELLDGLTDEQYVATPGGLVTSGIGGHVRHNLDHVEALLRAAETGELDYDRRERGTGIERDRAAARAAIRKLAAQLHDFPWADAPAFLAMRAIVAPDAPAVKMETSIDRELAFVLSHTIHHNALIALLAKLQGATLPPDFGYAPSTLAHRGRRPCAR
jgi:uncharacterized damage-inducible protein DinB